MAKGSRLLTALMLAAGSAACAGRLAAVDDDDAGALDVFALDAGDAQAADSSGHEHDASASPVVDAGPPLPASCDEDNPVSDGGLATDKAMPDDLLQFQRRLSWGCVHREWHETRFWDQLQAEPERYRSRLAYVRKMGWKRATAQEGEPTNGYDFLSMHRAMLGTLRAKFPQYAKLLAGWTNPPTASTPEDPVPVVDDASAPPAFSAAMQKALDRIKTDLGAFASDDELGVWIQSNLRATDEDPFARSPDPTAGIHAYYHVRFDDRRSAVRMQRFNRNIENQAFWRLHGWLDNTWSRYRTLKGLVDDKDKVYVDWMNMACHHMGFTKWDIAKSTCL